ncbi:UDP-glucuronosyl/UDP-glucosyltransferase [Colletotrichum tabaci]|uniref:UDP-glucuronosyl/UDP-glucosyltransferase n=1 Tax=Colletotrichum tabaci TaxID=1209068 RepID=A0AAV9SSW1_9PEZI
MLSFSGQRRHSHDDHDDSDAGPIDPESTESNQLIPARKRRHRVRVQGRLAVVRSVSTANLRPAVSSVGPALPSPVAAAVGGTATPAAPPKFESGVAGSAAAPARGRGMTMRSRERGRGRGRSVDDASSDAGEEDDDDARETAVRDRQFRGYGIGGAGNIRRPTEVYGATSKPSSLSSRFSIFNPSGSGSGSGSAAETDRGQWSFRELFARTGERKGKGVA